MEGTHHDDKGGGLRGLRKSAEFHRADVVDPAETLLEKRGPEGALDELERRLEENPNDEESLRQRALIINRLEDLLARLREKIQH